MPKTYTITLSDVEQKGMEYVATDVEFWIQNAVHERARLAIEELVQNHIAEKLAKGEAIKGTKEEIVMTSDLPNAQARSDETTRQAMQMMEGQRNAN